MKIGSKKVADWMGKDKLRVRETMSRRNERLQWLWEHYILEQKEPWVVNYSGGRLVVIHKSVAKGVMEVHECVVERSGILPLPKEDK